MRPAIRRIGITTALVLPTLLLSGCFTAMSRWWGNEPSADVVVMAATADIVTSPIQVTALALAAAKHRPYDREAALTREALENEQREASLAIARQILEHLSANPALLTDDVFWDGQPTTDGRAMYGLSWFLQKPEAPFSPAINRYLLDRFPEQDGLILSEQRTTHEELTTLAADVAQPYDVREQALDTLLRDPTFDFGEPWREMVLTEFQLKVLLLFGTRRYTRAELVALAAREDIPQHIRTGATWNLERAYYKDANTPPAP
ncbi:MAG: hypothetical protein ABII82_04145 [Verrucomicrobiota bacterium]